MNFDRELTRVVRSWLEEGVGVLPDRVLDDVLAELPVTSQRRPLGRAWRYHLMNATTKVALAGITVIAALAIGVAFVLSKPAIGPSATSTPAGECPVTLNESDITNARGWESSGGVPSGAARAGLVAAFSRDADAAPLSLVTVDPTRGRRCDLVHFAREYTLRNTVTQLKWSPTGDALAVALEGPDLAENGAGSGNVFVWTRDRLVRVWSAPGVQTPNIEWAPDGRSLAIWGGGLPVTVIYGDGSPDRTVDIHPAFAGNLHWSPDGSSWIFAEPTNELRGSTVSVVKVGDAQPRQLDLGQGIDNLLPVGWIDNDTVLLLDSKAAPDHSRYLKVPIAAPLAFTVVPIPDEGFAPDSNFVFSPDRTRGAYVVSGSQVVIVDVTGKSPGLHFPIDVGTDVFGVTWSPDGSQLMANTGFGVSELLLETAENGDIGRVRVAGTVDLVATGDSWQPAP